MSIKALSEILIYKEMKELYTEEERIKLKKELRRNLPISMNNISEVIIKIIDKINES